MHRLSPLLLLVLTACPKKAPAPAAGAEDVTFAFAWEPGWEATLRVDHTESSAMPGLTQEKGFDSVGSLRVTREGTDLAARWVYPESTMRPNVVNGETQPDDLSARSLRRFLGAIAGVPVRYRIREDGSFLGLVDSAGTQAAVDHAIDDLVDELADDLAPEEATRYRAFMDQLRSSTGLGQIVPEAQRWWQTTVAYWAGTTLEVGEAYEFVETVEDGRGGHTETTQFMVGGFEPCVDGWAETPTCAKVVVSVATDPAFVRTVMEEQLRRMFAGDPNAPVPSVQSATTVDTWVIWTEPDTLRPWFVHRELRSETDLTVGSEQAETTNEKITRYAIDWR